jgi:hypothetical protein
MIHDRELVGRVGAPRVAGLKRAGGLAGVANRPALEQSLSSGPFEARRTASSVALLNLLANARL